MKIFVIFSCIIYCTYPVSGFPTDISGGVRNPYRGMCPPNTFTETWLFHNETNKCFLEGQKGPCGEMMLFYKDPWKNAVGLCDCDDTLREWEKAILPEYCNWKRPRIYYPKHERCYSAFHQGPCTIGQWLVLDKNSNPKCETNLCNRNPNEDPNSISYWFLHEDKCYRSLTYGYCTNGRFLILNSDESITPICSKYPNKYFPTVNSNDGTLDISCPLPKKNNAVPISCRVGRRIHAEKEICRNIKSKNREYYYEDY